MTPGVCPGSKGKSCLPEGGLNAPDGLSLMGNPWIAAVVYLYMGRP